jgi:hypothetical protein
MRQVVLLLMPPLWRRAKILSWRSRRRSRQWLLLLLLLLCRLRCGTVWRTSHVRCCSALLYNEQGIPAVAFELPVSQENLPN